jgi:hypothetical protein
VSVLLQLKAGWLWLFSHRTKLLGGAGSGLTYAYMNQDKLQLVIPTAYYARSIAFIAGATLLVGCYNTWKDWRAT